MKVVKNPIVIFEKFPYRYVNCGILKINGKPDYRIQKINSYNRRYKDMYLLDNEMQLLTAIKDYSYTLWLDSDKSFNDIKKDDEDTDGL